jgi:hypothetical protein
MLSIFEDLFSGNFRHFRGDQHPSLSNLTGYGLAILYICNAIADVLI